MNTPTTPKLYDNDRDLVYLVVGYRDTYLLSGYPELKMYGLYKTKQDARARINTITGKTEQNMSIGNKMRCWINTIHFGDFQKTPNSGAFDKI